MKGLLRDRITIKKQDGTEFPNVRASVYGDKILTDQIQIPIEPGDTVVRVTPAGVEEVFIIDDPGYMEGGHLSHYEMKVRKKGVSTPQAHSQKIYNVTGPNARFNINSTDQSTNIVSTAPQELFEAIRETIIGIVDQSSRNALLEKTDELEATVGESGFFVRYSQFVALAADHVTLLAPFMPALAQLILIRSS